MSRKQPNETGQAMRPQERLLRFGAEALSDHELLSAFLRTGYKNTPVHRLAQQLLSHFATLGALFSAELEDFSAIKGVGVGKYVQLQAAFELTKRFQTEQLIRGVSFSSPQDVESYLRMTLKGENRERFLILHLDAQYRILASECLFSGTIDSAAVYPRDVVKSVLKKNAAAVMFAHNHPSGIAEPSSADIALTKRLQKALALVDVKTLDHFVVAGPTVVSFAQRGLI